MELSRHFVRSASPQRCPAMSRQSAPWAEGSLVANSSSAAKGSLYNKQGSAAMNTPTERVRRTNSCVPMMLPGPSSAMRNDAAWRRALRSPRARRLVRVAAHVHAAGSDDVQRVVVPRGVAGGVVGQ